MRQFLALELPAAVRDRLAELQRELARGSTGLRWIDPESIHLTLRFLGQVPESLDADARRSGCAPGRWESFLPAARRASCGSG